MDFDEKVFVSSARLRTAEELLDALDLYFRLHWAVVNERWNHKRAIEGIDEGVIRERHYALNCLLQFQNVGVDWDDVQTPTLRTRRWLFGSMRFNFSVMKFMDPSPVRCPACGGESALAVKELLALRACCLVCGASLRENGLRMRKFVDETTTFYDAILIIMHVEEHFGTTIPDENVEAVSPWEKLTLRDLVAAVDRSLPAGSTASATDAVMAAVCKEFPSAPECPDFTAPLLDALGNQRRYESY